MKFWLTYLLTALVASAAIEVGVPILRTHVVLPPPAVDLTPEPVPVAPTGRTARVSSTAIAALVAEATTATPSPAAPTPSVVTTAGAAEMPGAADRQDLTGVAPAIADTGPATGTTPWGVTATHVSYYSQTGEHRGTLAGGVIVDILRHSNASRGEMAVCRIEPEGGAGIFPALAAGQPVPDEAIRLMAKPPIPKFGYRFMANWGWRSQFKKRGQAESLKVQPYA